MSTSTAAKPSAPAAPPVPRPIRFVTNHEGPYAKRRRINSACLTCRRKKTRCSGERPYCGTCKQNKHECAGYGTDGNPSARGKKEESPPLRRKSNALTKPPLPVPDNKQDEPLPAPPLRRHSMPLASSRLEPQFDSSSIASLPRIETNSSLSLSTRNRMPYFRYFGPTAIQPGFKQMVVKIRGKQHSTGHTSSDGLSAIRHESSPGQAPSAATASSELRPSPEIPVYDTSTVSPSPLITHLCKLFLTHFGCTFPFLQPERFLRDLEEKQVDAILVDAVCALAARFSTHPLLTGSSEHQKDGGHEPVRSQPSEYGQAFAQRAKSAIPDAFHCPSVAVVQAALLLAYDEFGASRDSGLWMYLGIAIRMAQDLGMLTLEGLKYEGRDGPTPNSVKLHPTAGLDNNTAPRTSSSPEEEEQRAVERERLDTLWSIFFLDRVISSGTGRPVTIRDRDIEIAFPSLDDVDSSSGWPLPFPALIRVIHLYGRVTDLLNRIKESAHMTKDLQKQLDTLEYHLTEIYQGLSPKLHFNALNFQHYVKINQGTTFLLLHCWFHTLIVLLHQPTLLKTFEGSTEHLSNNSRELSMSSAKTVADILAFTELIDAKTGVGNPFTSQPIYIVACAFLKEAASHNASSNPHSRPTTPGIAQNHEAPKPQKQSLDHLDFDNLPRASNNMRSGHNADNDAKTTQKHTLLATAANQNYQRCYRALKALETYWAGVKYILTVLDQKAKGITDPLLYTVEEMESALEAPRAEPSFTSPGWRRKLSLGTYLTAENVDIGNAAKVGNAIRKGVRTPTIGGSPLPLPSQAIGWSLTGTMNSPSTNVAVMYTPDVKTDNSKEAPQPPVTSAMPNTPTRILRTAAAAFLERPQPSSSRPSSSLSSFKPTAMPPPLQSNHYHHLHADPVLVSEADLLLSLQYPGHSPSYASMNTPVNHQHSYSSSSFPRQSDSHQGQVSPALPSSMMEQYPVPSETLGDVVIDSQDIDMSALGAEMMPWDLEYLPHDLMFYGETFGVDGNEEAGEGGTSG
ncbi:hypothetical protein M011DRAFT_438884 [Sporormia fimetaria CBS 119925]|uniref:Zn(2)-C6 fungal-type domain-containing protein n=1 Tax=Sporormia fimetaria CBS 119925 TaxID=1340428 RepID=A0A6A6VGD7_9PLEO|nr:hypothetical protein M011DRAFT_438884 [Sporormia fimetaria CBS 119925]